MNVLMAMLLLGCADRGEDAEPVAPAITCPPGTQQAGALPPEGRMIWCETPDGVRQGPWMSAWDATDDHGPTRASEGTYEAGVMQGPTRSWYLGGHTEAVVYDEPGGQALVTDELGEKLFTVPYAKDTIAVCPEGTEAIEEALARWCQRPGRDGQEPMKHGRLQTQYPNGELESQMYYVEGELHGPFVAYHADKSVWIEGEYVAGKRHGHWMTWPAGEHTR